MLRVKHDSGVALVKEARGSCPRNVGAWVGGGEDRPHSSLAGAVWDIAEPIVESTNFRASSLGFKPWISGSVAV